MKHQIDNVSNDFDTKITNSETRISDLEDQISSIRMEVNGKKPNFGIIIACIILKIAHTLIILMIQRINRYRRNRRLMSNSTSNSTNQIERNSDYIGMQLLYSNCF